MSAQGVKLTDLSREDAAAFGLRPLVVKHRLHQLNLFNENTLLELIDNYPRDLLQAFTMGSDPLRWNEWQPVDTGGASAREIFAAVRHGRVWFKMLQVHNVDPRYSAVIDQLYAEMAERCANFRPVKKAGTLLVSSPSAMVYYHADAEPNLLWHIHGSKRVWVYPACDNSLISQELMEDIFAHVVDEEAPYKAEFDQKAVVFDLSPGTVISWPLNAPHRVTNLEGVNISLSTLHTTEESDRRKLVYCANRLLHRRYRIPARLTKEMGVMSFAKRFAYRALRRAGLDEAVPRRAYVTNLRIDSSSQTGFTSLSSGPVLTEFSKKDFVIRRNPSGQLSAVPKQ
jgi:hypothetical protein